MTAPARAARRQLTLRTKVLVLLLGLLAAVSAVVGVATDLALRSFLLGRLDSQLVQAGGRTAGSQGFGPGGPDGAADRGPGGTSHREPGLVDALSMQGPGTLVGRRHDGAFSAYRNTDSGQTSPVTATDLGAVAALPVDGRPHALRVDGRSYRALATRSPDDDVFVTALPAAGVDATVLRLTVVELAVTGIGLLLAALAAAVLVRLTLRPLSRIAATARRVSELPLNSLLGHVGNALRARQASESKVRQFVADASHELRTPLAAIRGYAELSRRSQQPLPPDVAHALGRVESEAVRMTSLVEDLLLLARLDAGRPLEAEPVDLSRLLVDAVGDAQAAGRDHVWRLNLPDEPVVVTGDHARLHQVVANLLSNARTHTPAGTTVTARVCSTGGCAVLAVLDDGPGVPPAVLPTVFERFARADTSRSRTAGSTGLGLAIVSAVVHAHGGSVEVTSEPGQTAFVVQLPLPGPAAGDRSGSLSLSHRPGT